jgi:hypothetical protein
MLKLYGRKIETKPNERQKGNTRQPDIHGAKEMINSGIEPLTLRYTSILGRY